MLLLEQRVRPLQRLIALHRPSWGRPRRPRQRNPPAQDAVARFLPPPRQHERMNLQGVSHGLDLHALQLAQFHRLELEFQTVLTDFHWTDATGHGHLLALGGSVYFIEGRSQPLMFRPLGQDVSQARAAGNNNFICVVRLRPGAQASQATAEFEGLIADYVKQFNIELKTALLPLHEVVTRGARAPLWLLLATGVAVWLMVCVNVANLVLVHAAGRDREAGIRMALGSSRGELFRLVLNEALALVVIGSAVGML